MCIELTVNVIGIFMWGRDYMPVSRCRVPGVDINLVARSIKRYVSIKLSVRASVMPRRVAKTRPQWFNTHQWFFYV